MSSRARSCLDGAGAIRTLVVWLRLAFYYLKLPVRDEGTEGTFTYDAEPESRAQELEAFSPRVSCSIDLIQLTLETRKTEVRYSCRIIAVPKWSTEPQQMTHDRMRIGRIRELMNYGCLRGPSEMPEIVPSAKAGQDVVTHTETRYHVRCEVAMGRRR